MIRTQVQFTEQQMRRLKLLAKQEGVSFSEVVRRCVEQVVMREGADRAQLYAKAQRMVGQLLDPEGAEDIAEHHDDYLAEAYK